MGRWLAALVIGWATPANAESIKFQSGDYADFRQLVSREAATTTVTIAGTLTFPDEARDRYPAVVIVHSIAGFQEANEGWHAAQFRKAGFATLTYESPAARRMLEAPAAGSSGPPPWASAESMPVGSPSWASPLAARSLISAPSNGCAPHSRTGPPDLPPTSPTTPRESSAPSPRREPIPAPRFSCCWGRRTTICRSPRRRPISSMPGAPPPRRRSPSRSILVRTTPGRFPASAPRASTRNIRAHANARIFSWDQRALRSSSRVRKGRSSRTPCKPV